MMESMRSYLQVAYAGKATGVYLEFDATRIVCAGLARGVSHRHMDLHHLTRCPTPPVSKRLATYG